MKGIGFYDSDFVRIKQYKDLIAESITRILMTTPGERVGRPEFGCNLRRLLFESTETVDLDDVKNIIGSAIETFEPRVILQDIIVNALENTIYVQIEFQLVGNPLETEQLEYQFNIGE